MPLLCKVMTPKQIIPNYRDPISFKKLAEQDEDFAKVVSKSGAVDWQDAQAVKQLTKSLLKRDFGLRIELPDDRLCPPVPNRFLYIRWIQKLLDSTTPSFNGEYKPDRQVLGIDIGTGASCIYPLLGTASRPNWSFHALDIDPSSLSSAQTNITLNNLSSRIRLHRSSSSPDAPLLPPSLFSSDQTIDFTICNPPFYTTRQEMALATLKKSAKPNSVCTGADVEMITEGGEGAFARRLLGESKALGQRVQWFTIMFGKLESLVPFIGELKERGVGNWIVGVLAPGQLTRRWVVGWSWMGFRANFKLVRPEADIPTHIGKSILCFSPYAEISFHGHPPITVAKHLHSIFNDLQGRTQWKPDGHACLLQTPGDVWSRRARRKQKALQHGGQTAHAPQSKDTEEEGGRSRFVVRLEIDDDEEKVEVHWLFGDDAVLFESFCGYLKRVMEGFSGNPNKASMGSGVSSATQDEGRDVEMEM